MIDALRPEDPRLRADPELKRHRTGALRKPCASNRAGRGGAVLEGPVRFRGAVPSRHEFLGS